MVFDERWEQIFSTKNWGKYPNEEAVRFVFRHLLNRPNIPRPADTKVLDLGCGAGSNLWMLCKEGFQAYGIDGSSSAIEQAKSNLFDLNLEANTRVGDITNLPFKNDQFWGVIDVSAIQHNNYAAIVDIYSELKRVLKSGGYFFSFCLSDNTKITNYQQKLELGTYDSPEPIGGGLITHFFSKTEILNLWEDTGPLSIETITRSGDDQLNVISHYAIVGTKS